MMSKTGKTSKDVIRRSPRFTAPGQLTEDHRYVRKASKVAKRLHAEEQVPYSDHRGIAHSIFVHFGEEKDFTEESSFLDVLKTASKFIDMYSVGIKIMDGDGKPIRNDQDLMTFLREQDDVDNINLYVEVDDTAQPLFPELLQDNLTYDSVPTQDSEGADPRSDSTEESVEENSVPTQDCEGADPRSDSTEENFEENSVPTQNGEGADSRSDPTEENIEEISVPTQDGQVADSRSDPTEQNIGEKSKKPRKVRGKNKNKKIAGLQAGKKLEIQFFNNRGVGTNHRCWSRHLGKIVRDKNICPVRVRTWKDMTETNKQDMWDWVTEYFSHPDMELYREHTLEHMDDLWSSWRSALNVKYVKRCKTKAEVLQNVPPEMDNEDWEWLVNNKFLTQEFQKASAQNSNNRVNGGMPHRTGSKPHRHILYEMGCNVDDPHDIARIFYETRQKDGKLEEESQEKYDEILQTVHANASLSPLGVVETCFGPQSHSSVIAFSGGLKRKRLNDSQAGRIKKLKDKLHEKKAARQKNGNLIEETAQENHDVISKTVHADASLSPPPAAVETRVRSQGHAHFVGFSGRVKKKHLINWQAARIKDLEAKLHEKEEEYNILERRMDGFEERLTRLEISNRQVSHTPPTTWSNNHALALLMK